MKSRASEIAKASIETQSVHAGAHPDPQTGAVMAPIYQTSTYAQAAPGKNRGFDYARSRNPTRDRLQESLATLEGGRWALSFASGMAAVDAVAAILKPGSHVVSSADLYGGTYRLFTKHYARYGFEFYFVDTCDLAQVEKALQPQTALVWLETPSNPLLNLCDIKKIVQLVHKKCKNALVVVDNTFATPILQKPLALGADIVCHSVTKYLAGHSDVVGGALVCNSKKLYKKLSFIQFAVGAVPAPWDCWLTLRGIKTLAIRMDRHCDNAQKIAQFLHKHPKVKKVYYPGLKTHPHHLLAKRQMRRFGGMISFILRASLKSSERFVSKRRFFTLAESLGGVESLIEHPASMTHASIPAEKRRSIGLEDGLVRLSVGIENVDDLLDDLKQGLIQLK